MAKHPRRLFVVIAAGIVVSAVVVEIATYIGRITGGQRETSEVVRVIDNHTRPAQWAINASYGRGALSNLRAALTEIANDHPEEAKKGLAVARTLLSKIVSESPKSLDTADIYEATDSSTKPASEADFVLIHSEVRLLGEAGPENYVQEKLDAFRRDIEMSDQDAVISALDSLDVPLVYTRVDMPLKKTWAHVNEALRALDSNDSELARTRLMEISNGLRINSVRVGVGGSSAAPVSEHAAG